MKADGPVGDPQCSGYRGIRGAEIELLEDLDL
jgi:hypothetical protein